MDLKIDALKARFQAEKLEAIATLEVYVKNAAGIGEHPQIIEEMAKLVEQATNANDCLDMIDMIFLKDGQDSTNVAQEGSVNS